MWDTAILLGDTIDPSTGKQAYDPGLAYTGKTVPEQVTAFKKEQKELKKRGIAIVGATIGHMVFDHKATGECRHPRRKQPAEFVLYR